MAAAYVFLTTGCSGPSSGPESFATTDSTCVMHFMDEDSLNLAPHAMESAIAQAEILAFPGTISSSSNPQLRLLVDSIDSGAFCALKDTADAFRQRAGACAGYFTGLKMCYGLSSDFSAVTILYQPVYLCRIIGQNSYLLNNTGTYYRYDEVDRIFVPETDTSAFKRYTDSILISHSPSAAPSHFRNPPSTNDSLGDARSVVFLFREIGALIGDNNSACVKVWNAVRQVQITGSTGVINKHDLLLGPAELTIPLSGMSAGCGSALFCNRFANLGNLCPPGCDFTSF